MLKVAQFIRWGGGRKKMVLCHISQGCSAQNCLFLALLPCCESVLSVVGKKGECGEAKDPQTLAESLKI